MRPPIFGVQAIGTKPQQYMHLARMFRNAAIGLPAYVNGEQNWPAYALMLHACELVLKAFCESSVAVAAGKPTLRAPNHDLRQWYQKAVQCGLPIDQQIEDGIGILAELHSCHYMRYPDNRRISVPELSIVANDVVDRLIAATAM